MSMKCFKCKDGDLKVTDTVHNNDDQVVYRRRKCLSCGHIVYTQENKIVKDAVFMNSWYKHHRLTAFHEGKEIEP